MSCLKSCAMGTLHTVAPYFRAANHISDVCDKWSYEDRKSGLIKGICVATGAAIGGAITIGLSPKMYGAFFRANEVTDEKTSVFNKQTDTGLKVGAGVCVALVDFWGISFGAMLGGDVGDGIITGAGWVAAGAKKVANCTRACFAGIRTACCGSGANVKKITPGEIVTTNNV